MTSTSTLDRLLLEAARALEPLVDAAVAPQPDGLAALAEEIGLDLYDAGEALAGVCGTIAAASTDLVAALEAGDPIGAANALRSLAVAVEQLAQEAVGVAADAGDLEPPAVYARRLLDYLILSYLLKFRPGAFGALELIGVIDEPPVPAGFPLEGAEPGNAAVQWPSVDFARLPQFFANPSLLSQWLGWGSDGLRHYEILRALQQLLVAVGVPAMFEYPDRQDAEALGLDVNQDFPDSLLRVPVASYARERETADGRTGSIGGQTGVSILPLAAAGDEAPGFAILPFGAGNVSETADLVDDWTFTLDVVGEAPPRYGVVVRPSAVQVLGLEGRKVGPPVPDLGVHVGLLRRLPGGRRTVLLGAADGTSMSVGTTGMLLDFELEDGAADLSLRFPVRGARLEIKAPPDDGFLTTVLPRDGIAVDFDITVGWSSRRGLTFDGSSGLTVSLPSQVSLGGVVDVSRIHLGLAAEEGSLVVSGGVSASLALGPLVAAVENVGLEAVIAYREDGAGNLGPLDFGLDFKPPAGMAIAVDAGGISGGGLLRFDPPAGRYDGILYLDVYEISVTAVALLDTRTTDGRPLPPPGFSFLAIISAEFPDIQLGFGFTLSGIGGLLGVHRTMAVEALQSGVRSGAIDHVLFPDDPLRNMPQIISDVRRFFPARANQYVFGPMAKIGWGTPTLIEGEVGLFLEFPDPLVIAILGQVHVSLPSKDLPVVALNVDVLGIIDFNNALLAIDASLYDSRIQGFPVYGDMVLRMSWGASPNFALSVGGTHPHYQPPPNWPDPRRVTVALGLEDNPRLTLQGYLAITSNTIQFGAKAQFYAAAGPANVSGWLEFDALVVLDPEVYFQFAFDLGLTLRWHDECIAGIAVRGLLAGPSPLHIRGEGSISLLFFDIRIGFEITLGERQQIRLPTRDPWPLLQAAIQDPESWSAELAHDVYQGVSIRRSDAEASVLVHPMGAVTLRQKVLPLNRPLDKFGEFGIEAAEQYELVQVSIGDETLGEDEWALVSDLFAPGQYRKLSDAQKLSRPSFEEMTAGVAVGSQSIVTAPSGAMRFATLEFESSVIDAPWQSRPMKAPKLDRDTQVAVSARGAKANSPVSGTGTRKYSMRRSRPPAYTRLDKGYAVTRTRDMTRHGAFPSGVSLSTALDLLEAHYAGAPAERSTLQAVPVHTLQEPL